MVDCMTRNRTRSAIKRGSFLQFYAASIGMPSLPHLGAALRPATILPAVLGVLRLLGVLIQALVDGGLDLRTTMTSLATSGQPRN